MPSISDYLEKMDHEFSDLNLVLNKEGYRVDNGGIKDHCNLQSLKSVDYFYIISGKTLLVEFSDIELQHDKITSDIRKIRSSDLDKQLKTVLVKERHKEISKEICGKYKDTLIIKNQLSDHFPDVPDCMRPLSKEELVIVVNNIKSQNKLEIARFYDSLRSKIITAIPKEMLGKVSFITIDFFHSNSL